MNKFYRHTFNIHLAQSAMRRRREKKIALQTSFFRSSFPFHFDKNVKSIDFFLYVLFSSDENKLWFMSCVTIRFFFCSFDYRFRSMRVFCLTVNYLWIFRMNKHLNHLCEWPVISVCDQSFRFGFWTVLVLISIWTRWIFRLFFFFNCCFSFFLFSSQSTSQKFW